MQQWDTNRDFRGTWCHRLKLINRLIHVQGCPLQALDLNSFEHVKYHWYIFRSNLGQVKVKLSLCFNWAPCHESVLGERGIAPLILWRRHKMKVGRQLYAPAALPPGKEPLVPIRYDVTQHRIICCDVMTLQDNKIHIFVYWLISLP
jgi:hypothetical protein